MDADVRAYLDAALASGVPPICELTPVEARLNVERAAPLVCGPKVPLRRVEDAEIDGVKVRLYASSDAAGLPVIAWFHGGGWVTGSLDSHDNACRHLAQASGALVVAVDYRLAPEHPYPAAVEDCWTVFEALAARGPRVAVGGDSAGGNLAAAVALRARDRGLPLAAQLLVYPVADADFGRASYAANADGFGLTADAMRWYWDQYVPEPGRRQEPDASPLRATSFADVAPALVLVCELDPLRDEGIALAGRLAADGVAVDVVEYQAMIHGFFRLHGVISRAHECTALLAEQARRHLSIAATA